MPWIIPLVTAGVSVYQAASSASKAKKAERSLEESLKNTPKYKPNQSILNYYDEALRKYNTNPSDTREYKLASQDIKQGTVQGLKALQDRRSGLAGVPTLIGNQNNSLLNAAVRSEQEKARQFGVVGQAAGMKTGEDKAAFQQNEVYPFESRYNLMSMNAAGNRADQRQNTQNAFNNASGAASILAGGDGGGSNWGTGRNMWGQQTRSFMGNTYTRPQYNKVNNAWSNSLSKQRFW